MKKQTAPFKRTKRTKCCLRSNEAQTTKPRWRGTETTDHSFDADLCKINWISDFKRKVKLLVDSLKGGKSTQVIVKLCGGPRNHKPQQCKPAIQESLTNATRLLVDTFSQEFTNSLPPLVQRNDAEVLSSSSKATHGVYGRYDKDEKFKAVNAAWGCQIFDESRRLLFFWWKIAA